jgi:hypothetical protein
MDPTATHINCVQSDVREKRSTMLQPIADCALIVARGWGWERITILRRPASLPFSQPAKGIDEALNEISQWSLQNHPDRLH